MSALYLIKALTQIKFQGLLLTCAPITELLSNKPSMVGHIIASGAGVQQPREPRRLDL